MKALINYKKMVHKILIHVDYNDNQPVIVIEKGEINTQVVSDVRDSLIEKFVENGHYAILEFHDNIVILKSMNPIDILMQMNEVFGNGFDEDFNKEFEIATEKLASLLHKKHGFNSGNLRELIRRINGRIAEEKNKQ